MRMHTPEEYNAAYVRGQETGREQGRQEVLAHIRTQADGWRGEASSVNGYHIPLKHVYRWLSELEDASNA